jgi:hypothetical protein
MAKPDLKGTAVVVLRSKLAELESEVRALKVSLAFHENWYLRLEREKTAADDHAEVLFNACRILAGALSNSTSAGRRAREEARELLESNKIHPPSTLGSSRAR